MHKEILERVEAGGHLARAEAAGAMEELLAGRAGHAEIVRLLGALRARPYCVEELTGFATAMRRQAQPVFAPGEARPEHLVDTCGTGGDGAGTFNISTAAAMVAAAAGARVAKHGNRSSAGNKGSGSADVLEALGVRLDLPLARVGAAIREIGIGFIFAQAAHTAMRHAVAARRELGGRTVFNLLGPLTNPAGAPAQVLGVFSAEVLELMAGTLVELGVERAFVVHGAGGLDEIALAGETQVAEVRHGSVRRYTVTPEEFGVARAGQEAIRGGDAAENAALIRRILAGEAGAPRDIVVSNAAAALVAAGVSENFRAGARRAEQAIDSGAAGEKLRELVEYR
ncbi:MAG: anthranilate phosphoribosyltransferase [Acidobacteriia bacterium]|nr:anthranilate phosphoribosyltransferase [Terriglobia bacterium]